MVQRLVGMIALVLITGLGVLVWACSQPSEKQRYEPDIVFRSVGERDLLLDLAAPAGEGPFPAVVCLHGGGWVSGDRKQMTRTLAVLSKRGYVAITPDYRLAPKYRYPDALADCKAAVAWLRENAAKYKVDPKRIGIMGLSAGGHLAVMTALEGGEIQAVVGFSVPCDLTDAKLHTPETLKRNLVPLLGGEPKTHAEAYKKASPLHHERVKAMPPALLVVGSEDTNVPPAHSEEFARKVNRAGGAARLLVLQGEGHTWTGLNLLKSIDEMLTFLDDNLQNP
jgi:acetyl esterase/lipase